MYNIEADKKERRKVVIFAGATVALILALIVAIVVVATNKSTRNVGGNDNASFTISEATEKTDEKAEEKKEEKISNSSKATVGTVTTKSAPATTASTVTSMPDTGPADLMLLATGMGGLTTAGVAIAMKKRAQDNTLATWFDVTENDRRDRLCGHFCGKIGEFVV